MRKIVITQTFHRFVAVGVNKPDRKETFSNGASHEVVDVAPAGNKTHVVLPADADDWIAKGIASEVTLAPAPVLTSKE